MEEKRTEDYQKDEHQEQLLKRINELLIPVEDNLVERFGAAQKPVLFIVGAPRAATTLVHQLVAQTGRFGYISNYLARFWMAPCFGALQEKALDIREDTMMSHDSDYGRTRGWHEPHQFNYFWQRWYQFGENHQMSDDVIKAIDVDYFRSEIGGLEAIFDRPLVFKSLYCGLQIPFLKRTLDKAKFIVCVREPLYQAQSILLGRKAFFNNYDGWFSLKPPEYPELMKLDPYKQVAGQIFYVLRSIGGSITKMRNEDYLIIDHEDLVENPKDEIKRILGKAGISDSLLLESIPECFDNRNRQVIEDAEWNSLRNAIQHFFHGKSSIQILKES